MTADLLAETTNFRDLGGIDVADGRTIRRGLVFRAATLSALDAEQLAALRALGIYIIVDLRRNRERALHPTMWEAVGCAAYWARDYDESEADIAPLLERGNGLTIEDCRAVMRSVYATLPFSQAGSYAHLFQVLLADEGPVLFHCAAGKDRTGVAAALILAALRARREAIVADYLASAGFRLLESAAFRQAQGLPAERIAAMAPLMTVEAPFLDSMFDAIAARHGSIEAYLAEMCGVRRDDLARLKDLLTE